MGRVTYEKISPEAYQILQDEGTWERNVQYFLTNGIIYCNGLKMTPEEQDPTVPSWAKEEHKPPYTAEEVGAVDLDNTISADTINRFVNAVFGI